MLIRKKGQFSINLKQQNSIDKEDSEALIKHSELEQQIVKNISNLQKVIIPMNKMYSTINGSSAKTQNDSEIEKIQNELSDLQSKVLRQNEINRDLLRVHIENIKRQINNFKNPYKNNRSVYAQSQKVAQLVEINV